MKKMVTLVGSIVTVISSIEKNLNVFKDINTNLNIKDVELTFSIFDSMIRIYDENVPSIILVHNKDLVDYTNSIRYNSHFTDLFKSIKTELAFISTEFRNDKNAIQGMLNLAVMYIGLQSVIVKTDLLKKFHLYDMKYNLKQLDHTEYVDFIISIIRMIHSNKNISLPLYISNRLLTEDEMSMSSSKKKLHFNNNLTAFILELKELLVGMNENIVNEYLQYRHNSLFRKLFPSFKIDSTPVLSMLVDLFRSIKHVIPSSENQLSIYPYITIIDRVFFETASNPIYKFKHDAQTLGYVLKSTKAVNLFKIMLSVSTAALSSNIDAFMNRNAHLINTVFKDLHTAWKEIEPFPGNFEFISSTLIEGYELFVLDQLNTNRPQIITEGYIKLLKSIPNGTLSRESFIDLATDMMQNLIIQVSDLSNFKEELESIDSITTILTMVNSLLENRTDVSVDYRLSTKELTDDVINSTLPSTGSVEEFKEELVNGMKIVSEETLSNKVSVSTGSSTSTIYTYMKPMKIAHTIENILDINSILYNLTEKTGVVFGCSEFPKINLAITESEFDGVLDVLNNTVIDFSRLALVYKQKEFSYSRSFLRQEQTEESKARYDQFVIDKKKDPSTESIILDYIVKDKILPENLTLFAIMFGIIVNKVNTHTSPNYTKSANKIIAKYITGIFANTLTRIIRAENLIVLNSDFTDSILFPNGCFDKLLSNFNLKLNILNDVIDIYQTINNNVFSVNLATVSEPTPIMFTEVTLLNPTEVDNETLELIVKGQISPVEVIVSELDETENSLNIHGGLDVFNEILDNEHYQVEEIYGRTNILTDNPVDSFAGTSKFSFHPDPEKYIEYVAHLKSNGRLVCYEDLNDLSLKVQLLKETERASSLKIKKNLRKCLSS